MGIFPCLAALNFRRLWFWIIILVFLKMSIWTLHRLYGSKGQGCWELPVRLLDVQEQTTFIIKEMHKL